MGWGEGGTPGPGCLQRLWSALAGALGVPRQRLVLGHKGGDEGALFGRPGFRDPDGAAARWLAPGQFVDADEQLFRLLSGGVSRPWPPALPRRSGVGPSSPSAHTLRPPFPWPVPVAATAVPGAALVRLPAPAGDVMRPGVLDGVVRAVVEAMERHGSAASPGMFVCDPPRDARFGSGRCVRQGAPVLPPSSGRCILVVPQDWGYLRGRGGPHPHPRPVAHRRLDGGHFPMGGAASRVCCGRLCVNRFLVLFGV
jgi:hypothetical protein